jgi:hypothetical protein
VIQNAGYGRALKMDGAMVFVLGVTNRQTQAAQHTSLSMEQLAPDWWFAIVAIIRRAVIRRIYLPRPRPKT